MESVIHTAVQRVVRSEKVLDDSNDKVRVSRKELLRAVREIDSKLDAAKTRRPRRGWLDRFFHLFQ